MDQMKDYIFSFKIHFISRDALDNDFFMFTIEKLLQKEVFLYGLNFYLVLSILEVC